MIRPGPGVATGVVRRRLGADAGVLAALAAADIGLKLSYIPLLSILLPAKAQALDGASAPFVVSAMAQQYVRQRRRQEQAQRHVLLWDRATRAWARLHQWPMPAMLGIAGAPAPGDTWARDLVVVCVHVEEDMQKNWMVPESAGFALS